MSYIIGLILVCFFSPSTCCYSSIWTSPSSQSVKYGEDATFECLAEGYYHYWFVNGVNIVNMTEEETTEKGISTYEVHHIDCIWFPHWECLKTSGLIIVGNCLNNNTEIYCMTFGDNGNRTSNVATLTVEADESSITEETTTISNASAIQLDEKTILITWGLLPAINHNYTLSLTIESTQLGGTVFTTQLLNPQDQLYHYMVEKDSNINQQYCVQYNITLTVETITCIKTYTHSKTVTATFTGTPAKAESVYAMNQEKKYYIISFKINKQTFCLNDSTVEILLIDGKNTQQQSSNRLPFTNLTKSNDKYQTTLRYNLMNNTQYQVIVAIHSKGGISYSDTVMFGTFDVEGISYNFSDLEICFHCVFSEGTEAKGCVIILINTDTLEAMALKIHRDQATINKTEHCRQIINGEYSLLVYDWENNGHIPAEPALTRDIVTVQNYSRSYSIDSYHIISSLSISNSLLKSNSLLSISNNYSMEAKRMLKVTSMNTQADNKQSSAAPVNSDYIGVSVVSSVSGCILLVLVAVIITISVLIIRLQYRKHIKRTYTDDGDNVTTLQMNSAYEVAKKLKCQSGADSTVNSNDYCYENTVF